MVIYPGDELYDDLVAARAAAGDAIIFDWLGQYYYTIRDADGVRFSEIEEKVEKDSLGKPTKRFRAPYAPIVPEE